MAECLQVKPKLYMQPDIDKLKEEYDQLITNHLDTLQDKLYRHVNAQVAVTEKQYNLIRGDTMLDHEPTDQEVDTEIQDDMAHIMLIEPLADDGELLSSTRTESIL